MLVAAAAPTLLAGDAAAEDLVRGGYVIPGFLIGGSFASPNSFVTGFELSTMAYPSRREMWGAGAFFQAMHYGRSDSPNISRYAGGLQFGGPIGLELGADRREGDGKHRTTWGVHVGPYVSAGFLTLTLRGTIPVTDSPGAQAGDVGVFLGFKAPIPFGNPPPDLNMAHGRPLVVEQRPVVAAVARTRAWA